MFLVYEEHLEVHNNYANNEVDENREDVPVNAINKRNNIVNSLQLIVH